MSLRLLMPGVVRAWLANRRLATLIGCTIEESQERHLGNWNDVSDISAKEATIGRTYDAALSRAGRLETKAIGVVQIGSIIAAVVAVVLTGTTTASRLTASVSLGYLALALVGAFAALRVTKQAQVLVKDARSATNGLAETAAAAATMEERGPIISNYVHGALVDVLVGGIVAFAALAMTLFGPISTPSRQPAEIDHPTSTSIVEQGLHCDEGRSPNSLPC